MKNIKKIKKFGATPNNKKIKKFGATPRAN
jgi:hypothetical protein